MAFATRKTNSLYQSVSYYYYEYRLGLLLP